MREKVLCRVKKGKTVKREGGDIRHRRRQKRRLGKRSSQEKGTRSAKKKFGSKQEVGGQGKERMDRHYRASGAPSPLLGDLRAEKINREKVRTGERGQGVRGRNFISKPPSSERCEEDDEDLIRGEVGHRGKKRAEIRTFGEENTSRHSPRGGSFSHLAKEKSGAWENGGSHDFETPHKKNLFFLNDPSMGGGPKWWGVTREYFCEKISLLLYSRIFLGYLASLVNQGESEEGRVGTLQIISE